MITFIVRRTLLAMITIWALSILAFLVVQLPPGDFADTYVLELLGNSPVAGGQFADQLEANLRREFGLDKPVIVQYTKWAWKGLRGDFGISLEFKRPVAEIRCRHLP